MLPCYTAPLQCRNLITSKLLQVFGYRQVAQFKLRRQQQQLGRVVGAYGSGTGFAGSMLS